MENTPSNIIVIIDNIPESAKNTKEVLQDTPSFTIKAEFKIFYQLDLAQQFIKNTKVRLIFINKDISGAETFNFVKTLREDLNGDNYFAPVIMTASNASKYDIVKSRDYGVTEFMLKPFTLVTMNEIIKSVLKTPRQFVISRGYKGPDRRRIKKDPPDGKKKRIFGEDDLD